MKNCISRRSFLKAAGILGAAGALAACGGSSASTSTAASTAGSTAASAAASSTSIKLWTYPIGGWGNDETVQGLVSSFNAKYPDIKVTVEYLDYTNGDDQVNTAIEGGSAPDLIMEGPERLVANWGAKGVMAPLNDLWTDDAKKDIYESVESACKDTAGNYYEYPLCMTAHCMAVNMTKVKEVGADQYIDTDKHTWSTDGFLKTVDALYNGGYENVAAIYCAGQGGDQGTRAIINNMYGGTFTDAAHTKYTADSAENIKAIQTLHDTKGINFDASIAGGDEITLFRNGTLQMAFCWNIAQQANSDNNAAGLTNDGDEIFPMAFPTDSGDPKLCGGIWGFGIFDNGDEAKIDAVHDAKLAAYPALFHRIRENTALFSLLQTLRADYHTALVTSATRCSVEAILRYFHRENCFDLLLTNVEVPHKKPAPDGFLMAMEHFGVAPADTIIFEDSPEGIQAAQASGAPYLLVREIR